MAESWGEASGDVTVAGAVIGNGTMLSARTEDEAVLAVGTPDSIGKIEPARENTAVRPHHAAESPEGRRGAWPIYR